MQSQNVELVQEELGTIQQIQQTQSNISDQSPLQRESQIKQKSVALYENLVMKEDDQEFQREEVSWRDLLNNETLSKSVESIYEKPNKIQVECWNHLIKNEDIILQGGNQVGKSLIQIIYLMSKIDCTQFVGNTMASITQGIIFAPHSRAQEIKDIITKIDKRYAVKCLSGVQEYDITIAYQGSHIVIGTPTQVYQAMKKEILVLNKVKVLLIDKIDQIFKEQQNFIYHERFQNVMKIFKKSVRTQVIASCTENTTFPNLAEDQTTLFPYYNALYFFRKYVQQYIHLNFINFTQEEEEIESSQQNKDSNSDAQIQDNNQNLSNRKIKMEINFWKQIQTKTIFI